MIKYNPFREKLFNNYIGSYKSYGIIITDKNAILRKVSDVSTSFWCVYRLCRLCNKLKLDSIHIDDVLEDMLGK